MAELQILRLMVSLICFGSLESTCRADRVNDEGNNMEVLMVRGVDVQPSPSLTGKRTLPQE